MADYSSDEIQAAVEKVVRSSIRRPYGTLGNRDIQTTFNDLQDAASGVYILKPNAPFYTIFLGAQRLLDLLVAEQDVLSQLIEAIENTNRMVTEIDNLAPLNNARAALDALSGAAGQRNNIFNSIEGVPAFQRYDQNVQRFLDESAKNSRVNNSIAPTPQESRASLAGLVRSLQSSQSEILSRSLYLAEAIKDYDSLQLPALIASSVVSKARDVLADRIAELEALTPNQRLSKIREITLDLLAGRAAVQGLGSLNGTTTFALIEGQGSVFADANHPANPAKLTALPGPYPIWTPDSNTLDFTMDGSFSFQVPVPGSFLARMDSGLPEPYVVLLGDNDTFLLSVDTPSGLVPVSVTLTPGIRTADDIVADITAALPPSFPIMAETVIQRTRFIGVVDIDVSGGPTAVTFTLPTPGTWEALGTRENDLLRVTDSLSANFGSEFTVNTGGVSGAVLTCTQVSGPALVTESLIEVQLGVGKTVRIRIADGFELQALTDRLGIVFPNTSLNTALTGNTTTGVPQSLGYSLGARLLSRATSADQVVQSMPRVATTQLGGVPRLDASTEFVASVWSGKGRSDPDNPNKLIAYKLRARGDAPAGTLGVVFTVAGGTDAGVVAGDVLVIRETPVFADTNVKGTVVSVTAGTITVDMSQAITGGIDLQLEVGPNLSLVSQYLDAQVTNSLSQNNSYSMDVHGQGFIPFEITVEGQVPFNRGIGGQPAFFTLELGFNRVVFQSTKTDLSTKVRVTVGSPSSAANKFFASMPIEAVGSSPYFKLPQDPRSLQAGDILEFNQTTYNVVTQAFELVELELESLLIQVSPEIASDFGSIQMSQAVQPPFGRIRLVKKNNYSLFEDRLVAWLGRDPNQQSWFTELSRLLNPLIVNNNPTVEAVSTAKFHVQQLLGILTRQGAIVVGSDPDETLESILVAYAVEPVEEVDVLVQTYLERGATRGIDILLQGRFSEFFGLSQEGMSYDGAAREALRGVQMMDLPIRKTGRGQDLGTSQTIAEWEDQDFEFDQSDTANADDVEIPGAFEEITPPGR